MGIGTIGVLGIGTAISVTSCDAPSAGEKFISLTPKSPDDTHFTFGSTDPITYKYKTINFTDHDFEITGNDKDEFQITDINISSSELTIAKTNKDLSIGSYSFKIHDKTENIDSDEQNVSVIEPTINKLYINGINN
jgi:hypothetical protein